MCPYCGSRNLKAYYPSDQVFEMRDDGKWHFIEFSCLECERWTILCEECGESWQERTIERYGEVME